MQVRVLTEADGNRYRGLRLAMIEESPELSSPEIVRELAFFARFGKGVLGNHALEGTRVWGACVGAYLAGVVAATRGFERGSLRAIQLWGLYVHPEFRGRGVGQALVRTAIEWVWQQPSATEAVLYANHGDGHALRLFRQCGFEFFEDEALRDTRLCAMRLDCKKNQARYDSRKQGPGTVAGTGQHGDEGNRAAGRNTAAGG